MANSTAHEAAVSPCKSCTLDLAGRRAAINAIIGVDDDNTRLARLPTRPFNRLQNRRGIFFQLAEKLLPAGIDRAGIIGITSVQFLYERTIGAREERNFSGFPNDMVFSSLFYPAIGGTTLGIRTECYTRYNRNMGCQRGGFTRS